MASLIQQPALRHCMGPPRAPKPCKSSMNGWSYANPQRVRGLTGAWPLAVRRREQGAVNRTWCKAHVPRGGKRLVDLLLSSLLLLLLTPFW